MLEDQNKIINSIKIQSDDVDVNTLSLRTMEKDLKNIGSPNFNAEDFIAEEEVNALKKNPVANLSERQQTSPFLNDPQMAVDNQNNLAKIRIETGKKLEPEPGKKALSGENHSEFSLAKIVLFGTAIFLILAGAAIGYYFIINREKSSDTATISNPEETAKPIETSSEETSLPAEEETVIQEKFNLDKPNFLVIESIAGEKTKTQEIIKDKLQKMKESKTYGLVEFVPTDKNFTPLTFQDFSQKIGLSLPLAITNNLKPAFSLFASNTETDEFSLALVIESKDAKQLPSLLAKEEARITKELDPLFLGKSYQDDSKPFLTNLYKNISLKYHNLSPAGSLSIDYAVLKGKLLLTTSKSIALSLVDRMQTE